MTVPSYPEATIARREDGFLRTRDGVRLYWQRYTPAGARATVAVFPGGGDHSGRYPALTTALAAAGFQVALVDFRGHGQSDGRRWHVDSFDDYLADADVFVDHVREGASGRPLFVVGHSQGGLIAGRWGLAPGREVAGFVLSSPYFRLAFEPPRAKVIGARLMNAVLPWVPLATGLRYEELTSDPELQRWTEGDPLYGKATTPRWFMESQRVQAEVSAAAARFDYPLLVLLGEADRIADPEAGRAFAARVRSSDKAVRSYPGFQHELFNERERARPIGDAVAWIAERAPG